MNNNEGWWALRFHYGKNKHVWQLYNVPAIRTSEKTAAEGARTLMSRLMLVPKDPHLVWISRTGNGDTLETFELPLEENSKIKEVVH